MSVILLPKQAFRKQPRKIANTIRVLTTFLTISFGTFAFISPLLAQNQIISLFDGESLSGWEVINRDQQWWTVTDGMISGGSLKEKVPHNTFIATRKSYQNFELKLKIRIQGAGGFINSGIQIRSIRVPNSSEMKGYQVDAGDGWWGKLYDESRRNKVIGEAKNLNAIKQTVRKNDWNELRIVAEGPRIRSWINGVPALDYLEKEDRIPLDGKIGIQVHGGGKALVQVKDVIIKELPATLGAMTWQQVLKASPISQNKVALQMRVRSASLTPEQERKGFKVPEGFEVELVASEQEGIGKFVTVAFDAQGRMWTMTALEYPVDANENPEMSRQLFADGGRDKVLIFDQPFGKQVSKPRVFADGLVMPLGILPYKDGVYVQYGHDIRYYRDTNHDGKADIHQVVLTGFGTQDSHLFPHQFTRTPGGWILMAQGLFNYSKVRRPNGKAFINGAREVAFNQCKLARFTHTGSNFEALTAGPNNIWGLTISREGETWLQEANDLGYPIIPYEPGAFYKTGSKDKLRPYQPLMPPVLSPPQMGGTGLSGLALADDRDGWPSPWGFKNAVPGSPRIFYVANPITSRIQVIRATPQNGRYQYDKLPDFLISEDPRFRPVALQFGPDGCLYVTDWYNKIISHNEVPRNHPERDRTRGRLWRIRHKSQLPTIPPILSTLSDSQLLSYLGNPNARTADLAWQEIVDRNAEKLIPRLKQIASNNAISADKRLGALWALEGLSMVPTSILVSFSKDTNMNLRREAVRIAASQARSENEFLSVAASLVNDSSPRVRAALGDALRRIHNPNPQIIAMMLQLGKASLGGNSWESYDREFERYLARWAMEQNSKAVHEFLKSPEALSVPIENRVLATLALDKRQAAIGLATLIPKLKRPFSLDEMRVLVTYFREPAIKEALVSTLNSPASRAPTLHMLLDLRTSLDLTPLNSVIETSAEDLWEQAKSNQERQFALEVARGFRLQKLDHRIALFASSPETSQTFKLAALRSLRELGSTQFETLGQIAVSKTESQKVRDVAITVLAESSEKQAAVTIAGILPELNFAQRQSVISRMAMTRTGAMALLASVENGDLDEEELSPEFLDTMSTLLPDDETLKELWENVASEIRHVLHLGGGNQDFAQAPITLTRPFTVESWVQLKSGINSEDGILGRPDVLDMNFYEERFRVWLAGHRDVVIASRKMLPDVWTHIAVTCDREGVFRVYLNGELSGESSQTSTQVFQDLNIGRTSPGQAGTEGFLTEYRIWNIARTPNEIRDNFDRSFTEGVHVEGLIHYYDGADWGKLSGNARVRPTLEAPKLLSTEQAEQQAKLFAKYRQLSNQAGNRLVGKTLFTKMCLVCHQQAGRGGKIGPALDGIGLKSTESLLRNILTPSAAMEGGYRNYRVLTSSGKLIEGLLVSQNSDAVVIRRQNLLDKRIKKSEIERAGFSSTSVMPKGLLDRLKPQEVRDLFAYMKSIK